MGAEESSLYRIVTTISFLRQVPLFKDVSPEYLARIAEIVEDKTLMKGEVLFSQGEFGDALYLVRDGNLRVKVGDKEFARVGPRECIGEMAILDGEPRSATAVASEDSRLLRISYEDFHDLAATQPAIMKAVLRTLTLRLRDSLK